MAVRGPVTCPVLIGRGPELEALADDLRRATAGSWVTVVSGPAGSGKSRLVAQVLRRAEEAGTTVLTGGCLPGAAHRYGPITSALLRHLRDLPSEAADVIFGGAAHPVRGLVPQRFADAPDLSVVDPTLVHAALVELFANLGRAAPVALVVEDVHWAGADTLSALAHAVAEAADVPLWLLLTHRDDASATGPGTPAPGGKDGAGGLAGLLATVGRRPHTAVALDALSVDEVGAMVAATLGADPPAAFVEELHGRSAGNPLLVEEFCRSLVEDGRLDPGTDRWPVQLGDVPLPTSIRGTVEQRLAPLPGPQVAVLRAAALIDEDLDVSLLAAVCDQSEASVERALAAGESAQILVEHRAGGIGGVAFRHALLREAVRDLIPAGARRELHRRIVEVLLRRLPPEEASSAVVEHLAAAGDRDAASSHAVIAAARAGRLGAPATARAFHERAVELARPGTAPRAVAALAAAEFLGAADPDRTLALAGEAHRYGLAHDDRLLVARSLMRASAIRMHLYGTAGRTSVLEATEWAAGRGAREEGDLLCHAVELLVSDGSHADLTLARELWTRAAALAGHDAATVEGAHGTSSDDARTAGAPPRPSVHAARLARLRCVAAATISEALTAGQEAVDLARECGDPAQLEQALWSLGTWLLWDVGDLGRAEPLLHQAQELAELFTARRPGLALPVLAEISAYRGAYDAALEEAAQPVWREAMAEHDACWVLVEVHRRAGRAAEALAAATRAADLLVERTSLTARIGAAAALGHGMLARHGARASLEHFEEALRWCPERARVYHDVFSPDLARALFDLGDHDRLREVATVVDDLSVTLPAGTRGAAAAAYCSALSALAEGRHEEAAAEAREASAAWAGMPFPARVVEADCVVAEAERRAGQREASLAAARDALATAERIASPPLVAEARATLERLGRAGRRAGGTRWGADALTPRERDVVRLTCDGFTAQQVAGRLGLSRRTVETHLGHAKDKLGAASKAELVRLAVELGLADASG